MSTTPSPAQIRPATSLRRREILNAAAEVFSNKGYTGGSLHEIAEQVNMTHVGVLHHFGSKDRLLQAVLAHRDDTDMAELGGELPAGLDLFRRLVKTAFRNAHRAGLVQTYAVLSAESVTDDHPARDYFENRYRLLRERIELSFFEMCAERGVRDDARIHAAAAGILAVMDGLQVQWLLDPEAVDLGTASEFAIEALVRSVLDPAPSLLEQNP